MIDLKFAELMEDAHVETDPAEKDKVFQVYAKNQQALFNFKFESAGEMNLWRADVAESIKRTTEELNKTTDVQHETTTVGPAEPAKKPTVGPQEQSLIAEKDKKEVTPPPKVATGAMGQNFAKLRSQWEQTNSPATETVKPTIQVEKSPS